MKRHLYIYFLQILFLVQNQEAFANYIRGNYLKCKKEGQLITQMPHDLLKSNPCLTCSCQRKDFKDLTVICYKHCPNSMEGCYRVISPGENQCCPVCQGCEKDGQKYAHGSDWTRGCHHNSCRAGVITSTEMACHSVCGEEYPPRDGECCGRCRGCQVEGQRIEEGQTVPLSTDPCVKCHCRQGFLTCVKKACPVLSCAESSQIPSPDGCCPICNGSKELVTLTKGRCFLNYFLYLDKAVRTFDTCTTCKCNQGYISCERMTCPALLCAKKYQVHKEGQCCPACKISAMNRVCQYQNTTKNHGERWYYGRCSYCTCHDGEVLCSADTCLNETEDCPEGQLKLPEKKGECCPKCVDKPSVCVVYGESHYRTFDGYPFDFEGVCKYDLAKDCKSGNFTIRLQFDARRPINNLPSRSLNVEINIENKFYKIILGQKLRTKVNGKRSHLPWKSGNKIQIMKSHDGNALTLNSSIGLGIVWDGSNYAEVEVSREWQNSTCGLCGNFNRRQKDDLTTRKNEVAISPEEMALSWGPRKTQKCYKRQQYQRKMNEPSRYQRLACPYNHPNVVQHCTIFNHTILKDCKSVVDPKEFFQSCLKDFCECAPRKKCQCGAITAYIRLCEKIGIEISPNWKEISQCGGLECPKGATYMPCAPSCSLTCRKPNPGVKCHRRECKPGCYCPPPSVLHKGVCISPNTCPKRKKRHNRT